MYHEATNFASRKKTGLSYTTVVVYSRDDEEVVFLAPKYHPKSSLKFSS